MSPIRRDAEGTPFAARSWESLSERLIREAQERGEFDQLPLHGKPLPDRRNPYAGEMALAYEMLGSAGVAPPWIEADKDARDGLARRDALIVRAGRSLPLMRRTLHRDMTAVVSRYNDAVLRLNASAPGPRQHRQPLVLSRELAALDTALDAGDAGDAGRDASQ